MAFLSITTHAAWLFFVKCIFIATGPAGAAAALRGPEVAMFRFLVLRFLVLRFLVLIVCCCGAAMAWAQSQPENVQVTPPRAKLRLSDEVHIQQMNGYLTNTAKPPVPLTTTNRAAPEGSSPAAVPGPTNPVTCDPKNASSPACFTATQQGQGRTK